MDRQRVHRAAVEERQARGSVRVRLHEWGRSPHVADTLVRTYNGVRSRQSLEYRMPDEVYFSERAAVTPMAA